jgi:hypothetical protein
MSALMSRRDEVVSSTPGATEVNGVISSSQPIAGDQVTSGSNGSAELKNKGNSRIQRVAPSKPEALSTTRRDANTVELNEREQALTLSNGSEYLPWVEVAKVWFLNERDKWVQLARQMSMPLAGGISGTTARLMQANVMLGGAAPASHVRFAAIGYLIPINAHSFHEIATAASSWVPYTAGSYDSIAPLTPSEITGLNPPASAQSRGVVA